MISYWDIVLCYFALLTYNGSQVCPQETVRNCPSQGIPQNVCQFPRAIIISNVTVSSCNEQIQVSDLMQMPRILFDDAQELSYYTVVFLGTEFLNWLVTDIPDCAFLNGTLTDFSVIASYIPPQSIFGFPLNYYVLIYRQRYDVQSAPINLMQRFFFNIGNFARQNALCGPVGGIRIQVY